MRTLSVTKKVAKIAIFLVLTTGYWPSYKQCDLTIPPELLGCLESFERFYTGFKNHNKLTWLHTLGHAMLDVKFAAANKKLEVSIYQGAIMLLFNTKDTYTFVEVQQAVNLPAEEVKLYLISLSCGKAKVSKHKPLCQLPIVAAVISS